MTLRCQPPGLQDASGREFVEELERLPLAERPTDFVASVETEAVVMIDEDGNESSVPLPEDEFYLSVAPYVDQTHAWLSIIGFVCIIINYAVVNVFFPGLHSYAGLPE